MEKKRESEPLYNYKPYLENQTAKKEGDGKNLWRKNSLRYELKLVSVPRLSHWLLCFGLFCLRNLHLAQPHHSRQKMTTLTDRGQNQVLVHTKSWFFLLWALSINEVLIQTLSLIWWLSSSSPNIPLIFKLTKKFICLKHLISSTSIINWNEIGSWTQWQSTAFPLRSPYLSTLEASDSESMYSPWEGNQKVREEGVDWHEQPLMEVRVPSTLRAKKKKEHKKQ